jgi:hypothetical protein
MVPIVVAVALSATLTAQTPARHDLGRVGDSFGQSVTADGRYTTQTSDIGVQLVDITAGHANPLSQQSLCRTASDFRNTPRTSVPMASSLLLVE